MPVLKCEKKKISFLSTDFKSVENLLKNSISVSYAIILDAFFSELSHLQVSSLLPGKDVLKISFLQ